MRGSDGLMSDVMIDVKDHGPGISAEDQLKLFGSFVQINAGELQQGAVRPSDILYNPGR